MKRTEFRHVRLFILALMALPLLSFPILSLAKGWLLDLPIAFLYLFSLWAAIILVAARIAEHGAAGR